MKSSYYTPGKLYGAQAAAPTPAVPQQNKPVVMPKPVAAKPVPVPVKQAQPLPAADPYKPTPNPHGKYMSGNILQKAIDVISTPYYATAGLLQGAAKKAEQHKQEGYYDKTSRGVGFLKGQLTELKEGIKNVPQGVANRRAISAAPGDYNLAGDYFGVKNKAGQTALNFGASLLAPNLPIGAAISKGSSLVKTIAPSVVNSASKAAANISNAAKSTPAVYKPIEWVNPYFRNKEAGKILQGVEDTAGQRVNDLYNVIKRTSKGLNSGEQQAVGAALEGKATPINQKLIDIVNEIRPIIKKVGEEAKEAKLLKQETLDKFKDGYMPHTFFNPEKIESIFSNVRKTAPQISGKFFEKRKGKEGYIQEYAPAVFKGIGTEMKDIEAKKGYLELVKRFGTKVKKGSEESAHRLINNEKVATVFRGYKMPSEIIDYINRSVSVSKSDRMDKALNYWKAAKTIYNPAYHIRNLMSNQILSDMSTGRGIPRTIVDYVRAIKQYRGKGDQTIVNAAEKVGLIKRNNFYESLDEFLNEAGFGQKTGIRSIGTKFNNGIRNFQKVTEETSKLSVFKTWVDKLAKQAGKSYDDALNDVEILKQAANKAEEAIFSPYRIGAAERNVIGKAFPFYSFTRQALPFTVKTAAKNPERITKYYRGKDAVESLSSDEGINQDDRPKEMRGMVRLPTKDAEGRNKFFDPTYILPWGNFQDLGGEQGKLPFGLSVNPFISEAIGQISNFDAYTQQPIARSNIPEVARGERIKHFQRTMQPTVVGTIQDKLIPAFQGKTDYAGRTRGKVQAIVDALGFKTQKVSPAEMNKKTRSKSDKELRSLQDEAKSIINDNRLTEEEKSERLIRLREIYNNR